MAWPPRLFSGSHTAGATFATDPLHLDRNEEENLNVTRHARGTKRRMAQILSDPIMRDLQDKALEFHANRVEMLRKSGEYDQWVKDLKEASEIPLDKLDEVLFVQHLPKEWQER